MEIIHTGEDVNKKLKGKDYISLQSLLLTERAHSCPSEIRAVPVNFVNRLDSLECSSGSLTTPVL